MQADAAADSLKPFKDELRPRASPDVDIDEAEDYSDGDFEQLDDRAVLADDEDARHAAIQIQAIHRGNAARQDLRQHKAATQIQAVHRGQTARRALAEQVDALGDNLISTLPQDQDASAMQESAAPERLLGEEDSAARQVNTPPELEPTAVSDLGEDEGEAARKIQAVQRGRAARQAVGNLRQEQDEVAKQTGAAVRIQAARRGQQTRTEQAEQQVAAARIQAVQRGKAVRRQLVQSGEGDETMAAEVDVDKEPEPELEPEQEKEAELELDPELEPEPELEPALAPPSNWVDDDFDDDFADDFGDIDVSNAPDASKFLRGRPLDLAESRDLRQLVLGPGSANAAYDDAWVQGLTFNPSEKVRYGLWQEKGGPCGVLAALQAAVLEQLLHILPPEADDRDAAEERLAPSDTRRQQALAAAIGSVLWRAGQAAGGGATVVLRSESGATANLGKEFEASLVAFSFDAGSREEFDQFLKDRACKTLSVPSGGGVLLFLLSALLSRTVEGVRADMDVATSPLIGGHGYCQQELVNLLLIGHAHSNVFDGVVEMDPNTPPLKGVPERSDLGYLTLFEALNPSHIQVGENYKQPRRPIYVVCSESHYSVLFSTSRETEYLPGAAEIGSFEMHYYDELGRQDEEVIMTLTVDAEALDACAAKDLNDATAAAAAWKENAVPPLELVLQTRWPAARVDWNGTDPIL